MKSSTSSASWTSFGDTGVDTSWVSIACDIGEYLYALRKDGIVSYTTETSGTWNDKGDAGDDYSWTSITAFSDPGYVYAMRNDRSIYRASTGTSSTWISWANSGSDTSWTSIASNADYIYVLRNDGRVDRVKISDGSWTSPKGDVGTGTHHQAITVPIPEFLAIILPIISIISIFSFYKKKEKCKIRIKNIT